MRARHLQQWLDLVASWEAPYAARFAQRLNPATLSRPDSRPTVREKAAILGNLLKDFDFTQDPIPHLILDPNP